MRNLIRGIKNFWYFRKEIWEFRDFDYAYNLTLFRKSLVPLRDRLRDGITESGPDDAESIQRFLDATDNDIAFWDVCEEYDELLKKTKFAIKEDGRLDLTGDLTKEESHRKAVLCHRGMKWEEARWNRAMKELSKMRGWWE